jgi:hypothetical protein
MCWRAGVPLRGMSTKKDGPLSKRDIWAIAIGTLLVYLFLATVTAFERRDAGLPIF